MNNIPRTGSLHNPGASRFTIVMALGNVSRLICRSSCLICRSSCTCPESLCCCCSLTDCSSVYLFLPAGYLTDCSSWSWRGCGWCTEIHRCCWDLCSTYQTDKKISHHRQVLVGSKGFGVRGRYRTYLSSIRASRLAWPHLRLWSLLEHFFVKINPARNPTRMEMTAVQTQARERVFLE